MTPQDAIDAFSVGADGYASAMPLRNPSAGLRPFSLAFRNDSRLVVVESFNAAPDVSAASSYQLLSDGAIIPISASVPNGQTDVCWVVITNDGRFVYTGSRGLLVLPQGAARSRRVRPCVTALSVSDEERDATARPFS